MKEQETQRPSGREPTRVHVVDSDTSSRVEAVKALRGEGHDVIEHHGGSDLSARLSEDVVACVVLDLDATGVSGLSLLDDLAEHHASVPVIMMSGHADIRTAVDALRIGAVDFLERPVRPEELIGRVAEALDIARVRRRNHRRVMEIRRLLSNLTPRESEVMGLLRRGKSVKRIAYEFGVSHKTVQVHRARILERLQVGSVVDLSNLIHELEMLDPAVPFGGPSWAPRIVPVQVPATGPRRPLSTIRVDDADPLVAR